MGYYPRPKSLPESLMFMLALIVIVPYAAAGDPAGRDGATFEGLGYFDGDFPSSNAEAVSADGSIVVGSSTGQAFRWEDGVMEPLGALPGGNGQGGARGVSLDGAVVVGLSNSANGNQEAFRWQDGTMEALGDLDGPVFNSVANATSAPGFVVVGQGVSTNGIEAFRWENGTMTGLGDLEGGDFNSRAYGISTDASVIVGSGNSDAGFEAFRWTLGGGMEGLGDTSAPVFARNAYATSFNGAVIVGSGTSDNGTEAFRWENGEIEGLGGLPGGSFHSAARAVSGNGSVIVGESSVEGNTAAFIWTAEQGMRSIQAVLEQDYGLDLTGWTLRGATAISSNGAVVVGYGTNPEGRAESWRATGLNKEVSAPPALSFTPAALDFGAVGVGTTSAPATATLENTGDGTAGGLTWVSPDAGFDVDVTDCGDTLPAGESCTVVVTFTPAATGIASAVLEVQAEAGEPALLDLTGDGIELPEEVFRDRFEPMP